MAKRTNGILVLQCNGDPYGRGFVAVFYKDKAEEATGFGVYQGDKGPRTREFWRRYAWKNDYVLREER